MPPASIAPPTPALVVTIKTLPRYSQNVLWGQNHPGWEALIRLKQVWIPLTQYLHFLFLSFIHLTTRQHARSMVLSPCCTLGSSDTRATTRFWFNWSGLGPPHWCLYDSFGFKVQPGWESVSQILNSYTTSNLSSHHNPPKFWLQEALHNCVFCNVFHVWRHEWS